MGDVKKSFVPASLDGGVVFVGPTGVLELPARSHAAPGTALPTGWAALDLGTLSSDGLSISYTRSSTEVNDFDGAVYRNLQDKFSDGFKAKFLDADNHNLVETVYGTDNVEITAATGSHGEQISIVHSSDPLPYLQAAIKTKDAGKGKLYVAELCQVTEIAEIKDVYNDVTSYELTFSVYRGSDGKFLKEFRDDGVIVSGS
ncbi:hypothetical protein [Gordonia sp. NPDC003950]